ncbi:acetylglutamate kinase, chloroplastic [Phalaenopsis equestris]|uniref:acetylglutamate kinase, chloroplastic n=1 Tax=Phalaenopsis equestris TaxID=78828 RepID=UPI0009E5AE8D|nr:acetylglutamate kinase, chloroplastic [Phalaenopsis equestris]
MMLSAKPLTTRHPSFFPSNFSRVPNTNRELAPTRSLRIPVLRSVPLTTSVADPVATAATPALTRVDILSESLPFIQRFHGKTIVVKYGGAAMKSPALQASVINDLVLLACVGLRPVFVHGGGPEINSWLLRLGVEPEFRNGLRVTDALTMEVVEMVLVGKINKSLVSLINLAGGTAIGLCGKDARLLTARPSPDAASLGFVGEIARVDPSILRPIIANGHIPVIASVAAVDMWYEVPPAGKMPAAIGAEKLILLTDVAGILTDRNDPGSLVKEIDISGVRRMVEEGKVAGGMIPKVNCCVRSVTQGVRTASIIDGRVPHSLLLEILTDEGAGTMISG